MKGKSLCSRVSVLMVLAIGIFFGNIPMAFGQLYIGSISGRVIDADTGVPLPGVYPHNTYVELCREDYWGGCGYFWYQGVGSDGEFHFDGSSLEAGTYQVRASSSGYTARETDRFQVDVGENENLGDLPLELILYIGSISGRIVDAVTGNPLPGDTTPFTSVNLLRCTEWSGCLPINSQPAGGDGRFDFRINYWGMPLEVGTYYVTASAQEYKPGQTEPFPVGEGDYLDLGDVPLQPFPFGISEIRPCGALPPEGGTCGYSVRVANRLGTVLDGAAWSLVSSGMIGSHIGFTSFQTANPQRLTLPPGASKVIRFEFNVPNTVTDGASICAQVFVGQDRSQPFFNTVGQRNLFCITKGYTGAFSVVSENEAQGMLRELNASALTPSIGN